MQSKVTQTRMHKTIPFPNAIDKKEGLVPVADGQVVLIELVEKGKFSGLADQMATYETVILQGIMYKPIIISLTEKIEEGDCTLYEGEVIEPYNGGDQCISGRYKILVLPEQFSPKHLQAIVDGKMNDGDKVLVECIDNTYIHEGSGKYWEDKPVKMKKYLHLPDQYIKLNSQGHVTLHRVEEKYTRDQMYHKMKDLLVAQLNDENPDHEFDFDNWFEQNVK